VASVDRTVVVTGASSGIGEACAARLAGRGWRVLAGVRRDEDADRMAALAGRVEPVPLDVTEPVSVAAAAERLGDGSLAGTARRRLTCGPRQQCRNRDCDAARVPAARRLGAYAASKHALEAVTDALRVELRPFGIEVAIVEPATIATPIWKKGGERLRGLLGELPDSVTELYGRRMEAFRKAAADAERRAEAADLVAVAVEHALTAERPKTRYLVGRDARRRDLVERLPDRLRDRVYERVLF
jgi:NAD(P)-dependent dehydrogenase (short-subunit alcohol dehydrogenase family)